MEQIINKSEQMEFCLLKSAKPRQSSTIIFKANERIRKDYCHIIQSGTPYTLCGHIYVKAIGEPEGTICTMCSQRSLSMLRANYLKLGTR